VLLRESETSDWQLIEHIKSKGCISDTLAGDSWSNVDLERQVTIPSPFVNLAPELRQELIDEQLRQSARSHREYQRRSVERQKTAAVLEEQWQQWREQRAAQTVEAKERERRWREEQDAWQNDPILLARAELERRNAKNQS
jgi:hypothetical protein